MSNYSKLTNFAVKDSLPTGNPNKIIKGTEIDVELTVIQNAIATKGDSINGTFDSVTLTGTNTVTGLFYANGANITGFAGGLAIGGLASYAAILKTPRAINLSGDVTGTASFDGSSDITIPVTLTATATQTYNSPVSYIPTDSLTNTITRILVAEGVIPQTFPSIKSSFLNQQYFLEA